MSMSIDDMRYMERLKEQARRYLLLADKNICLQNQVQDLEEKLRKAVDFIDFQHRPLFSAVETLLMNTMREDLRQLNLAFEYRHSTALGPQKKTTK